MLKLQQENDILKYICKKVNDTEITEFIVQQREQYPIHIMCDVLDVPRSTYHTSLDQTLSNRNQENHQLTERIIEIHRESKQRFGAPKIYHLKMAIK